MDLIIASDIFGKTPEFEKMVSELTTGFDIIHHNILLTDPYGGQDLNFNTQEQAYEYFQKENRRHPYALQLLSCIRRSEGPVFVIGFSVGASALWSISNNPSLKKKKITACCFYPSQIRYLQDIRPLFPIDLVFPCFEPRFSVDLLIESLSDTPNTTSQKTGYLHGFMNRKSTHFNPAGYALFIKNLRTRFISLSHR